MKIIKNKKYILMTIIRYIGFLIKQEVTDMTDEKITYEDVKEYESLFTIAPAIVLEAMIKKNVNLVKKFRSVIVSYLKQLTPEQKAKLMLVLATDIVVLQKLMFVAYKKTGKKQFYLLANPANRLFVAMNLKEISDLVAFLEDNPHAE
ncbi:MAG: hypothetical protein BZ137_09095 [Methanosphaera sp. rholeuAM130]|nr:MAG: hypothetical protein BZ137_09095 [Methanosphaera sp. rholeuAM130]